MSATFVAKQMFKSAAKSVESSVNSVKTTISSSTKAKPAQEQSNNSKGCCSCFERVYFMVADATGTSTPEEKRKREFQRLFLAMLRDGAVFQIVEYERQEQNDIVSQMSKSVTSLFSVGASAGKSTNSDACGMNVVLSLNDSVTVSLEWKTLELEQNKPRFEAVLPLHRIQVVDEIDKGSLFALVFRDHHGKILLSIQTSEKMLRNEWKIGLTEAMAVLAPQIEENASENRGMLHRQQKYIELERRKKEREKKKSALGDVGMKYTAQAMLSQ